MSSTFPLSIFAGTKPKNIWVTPRKNYKCLYNIELLMNCNNDISSQKIKWVVEKLASTDVDAVMCCPTAWRTNMFPSEVDPEWKKFTHIRDLPKFEPFDYVMKYIHDGGDPVRDTLEASRAINIDFFISYRLNDWHNIDDKTFPTHNAFWREHPEYWLGDRNVMGLSDNIRLFNYMIPEVRDHYFSIIEELCTNYDTDGVELDFQRVPRFFHDNQIKEGMPVMTGFVKRIREMLNRIGKNRGKSMKLCVRIPDTVIACEKVGLDVIAWDAHGLIDMINLSPFFLHGMEIGIEEFKAKTKHAKIFGEMHMLYAFMNTITKGSVNELNAGRYMRYTTFEMYRATAMNFLERGTDGLSIFNLDYVDGDCYNDRVSRLETPLKRSEMPVMLKGITDIGFLKTTSKDYIIYPNGILTTSIFPAKDEKSLKIYIADDTSKVKFERSMLRVETKENCVDLRIGVWLNGKQLATCENIDTEFFPPVHRNNGFPTSEVLKFYAVPLDLLIHGDNLVEIKNLDKAKASCTIFSMELALYRPEHAILK